MFELVERTGYTERELDEMSPEFVKAVLRGGRAMDRARAELQRRAMSS